MCVDRGGGGKEGLALDLRDCGGDVYACMYMYMYERTMRETGRKSAGKETQVVFWVCFGVVTRGKVSLGEA